MIRPWLLAPLFALAAGALTAQTPDAADYFERRVRPVLVKNCQGCHNAKVKMAGLDMSTGAAFAHGGASGPLVNAEHPEQSALLRVTSYEGQLKMPPTGKLKDEDLAILTEWVKAGAPWPGAEQAGKVRSWNAEKPITDEDRRFWAFQPIARPVVPTVANEAWVRTAIDRFVLARLEAQKLTPAAPASKPALLRRVTYDLTGLPPTPEEMRAFVADASPDAFAKVVDRLLASPRYGEKWGRHWLDVARYADSTGNDEDHRYPHAWRYRDYVIEAFNQDLPYDQFVREQVAGDLLPGPAGSKNTRGIVATGLLALGPKAIAQQDKKKMLYDVYDEQIEVTSRAFLGLTVQCARCHDHKFDPILTRDYYSLAGIFASTRSFKDPETHVSKLLSTPLVPDDVFRRYQAEQDRLTRKNLEIEDLIDEQSQWYGGQLAPRLADYMVAARAVIGGRDAATEARERTLRAEVLDKWVKYLKSSDKGRIHLHDWENASPDQSGVVARKYQAQFTARLAEWSETMGKWRETFRRMTAEGDMPPPPRPKFPEDKDRFFFEVYFEGPFAVPKKEPEQVFPPEAKAQLTALREEARKLKEAMPPEPDMATAVEEGDAVQQKVFVRGDYNSPGQDAPKAFPTVLMKDQPTFASGSGRRELAEWLTRPDHPLTARVMVNRVWQWHFGEGLVRTSDNFGRMGERPTHPELLDWLTRRFVEDGWSVKKLHRLMLLSSAYQMATEADDATVKADPENKLFSRFPRRRLAVEEIRDGLLAIDGSLDLTMGGTLQKGTGTDSENSNSRLSVKPETEKRRMVYLPLRRANLPTMLNLFDFGDATTSQGKRALTTVAPQALFMMNGEFVVERARKLAEGVLQQPEPTARVKELYRRVLNREPAASEVDEGLTYVSRFTARFAPARTEQDAWQSLSRVLIGSNEFVYVE